MEVQKIYQHEKIISDVIAQLKLNENINNQKFKNIKIKFKVGKLITLTESKLVQLFIKVANENNFRIDTVIEIEWIPIKLKCKICGLILENKFMCPICHNENLSIISGEEFMIESVNIIS